MNDLRHLSATRRSQRPATANFGAHPKHSRLEGSRQTLRNKSLNVFSPISITKMNDQEDQLSSMNFSYNTKERFHLRKHSAISGGGFFN